MKRKTKEITSTERPKKPTTSQLKITLTEEQMIAVKKLSIADSHDDCSEWAKKQICRIIADRSRETR